MEMENIKVIGVDPAPKNPSTVYDKDNGIQKKYATDLVKYLNTETDNGKNKDVLICWDAPLVYWNNSFWKSEEKSPKKDNIDYLYCRPIEKFFQHKDHFPLSKKIKKKQGVSVLSYAGCPHWTISKYCLGLPIIGQYDKSETPFDLITNEDKKWNSTKSSLIEVHPAVAMYYWLGKDLKKYKGNKVEVDRIWKRLQNKVDCFKMIDYKPKDDDELDAIVAYVLGNEWANNNGGESKVQLFGDATTGSFLLPFKTVNHDLASDLKKLYEGGKLF